MVVAGGLIMVDDGSMVVDGDSLCSVMVLGLIAESDDVTVDAGADANANADADAKVDIL